MNMHPKIRHALRRLKGLLITGLTGIQGQGPHSPGLSAPVPYHFSEHDAQIVAEIVRSGKLHHDQGQEMVSFEHEFAGFAGVDYAIATNSGTSALMLAIHALGLAPGDEVIVPAYAFVAAAQAVLSNNAIPVFADIDSTCTISPKSIKYHISKKTKAIIVVHMFGNVADMDKILSIAKKHHLRIIEDCAQAVGAFYNGKPVGSLGDIGCFSFNIKKAIPTGQGGMIVTSNAEYDRKIRIARNTGLLHKDGKIDTLSFGGTYFMTEIEAVLGRSVLRQLTYLNGIRKQNYLYLSDLLYPLRKYLGSYNILPKSEASYSRLSFLLNIRSLAVTRDQLITRAQQEGVPLKKFYPTPLYQYSLFKNKKDALTHVSFPFSLNKKLHYDPLPFAEKFHREHIGMEFSPYWNFSDMREIARVLTKTIHDFQK